MCDEPTNVVAANGLNLVCLFGRQPMVPSLTQELLTLAQAKLKDAERALQFDPANKWLKMSVQFAQDKVEAIRQSLTKDQS